MSAPTPEPREPLHDASAAHGIAVSEDAIQEVDRIAQSTAAENELKAHIHGVPPWTTRKQIETAMQEKGMRFKSVTHDKSKTFAFVKFDTVEDRDAAIARMGTIEIRGRKLRATLVDPEAEGRVRQADVRRTRARDLRAAAAAAPGENGEGRGKGGRGGWDASAATAGDEGDDKSASFALGRGVTSATHILDVVSPWWRVPYEHQLQLKQREMEGVVVRVARRIRAKWVSDARSAHLQASKAKGQRKGARSRVWCALAAR